MLSFMMPFSLMSNCTVEQPVFAPNYITGTIQAAPDGGWEGQATFKLAFRKGGAIQFFQLMIKAISAATQGFPLGTMNYWFGPSGLFVVTQQGRVVCNQDMPCSVFVYGPQPMRYGAPPPGAYGARPPGAYGTPPPGAYGAPPPGAYGTPLPVGYRAPPVGYRAPPVGYGAPPVGYGAPPVGYGAPPVGYGAPPVGYGAPPIGYGAPSAGYEALPVEHGSPPVRNEAPPPAYEALPARNRTGSHSSVEVQPTENEASLPSASSQAHSPPSKN